MMCRGRGVKTGEGHAIERSRGGLSPKIDALANAQGNLISLVLTGGEAHDLVGADHLLLSMQATRLSPTKPTLAKAGRSMPRSGSSRRSPLPERTAVIPPKPATAPGTSSHLRVLPKLQ